MLQIFFTATLRMNTKCKSVFDLLTLHYSLRILLLHYSIYLLQNCIEHRWRISCLFSHLILPFTLFSQTPLFLSSSLFSQDTVVFLLFLLLCNFTFITKAQIFQKVFLGHVHICRFSVFSLSKRLCVSLRSWKLIYWEGGIEQYFLKQQNWGYFIF